MLRNGVLDFLDGAIKAGRIRFAGFSFHDDLACFKEIVDAYEWSFCQIMYNYYDEHFQAGREGLEYAVRKNVAVVAMEPLRGGALVKGLPEGARQLFSAAVPGRSDVEWALHWLWSQPGISVVLSGMTHMDHVVENLELADRCTGAPWTEKDEKTIHLVNQVIRKLQRVPCTSCGYCLPCPEGVNIPRNFELCNDHYMLNDPSAKARYQNLLSDQEKATGCVQCGICVEKCPQQIAIPDELEVVGDLFKA